MHVELLVYTIVQWYELASVNLPRLASFWVYVCSQDVGGSNRSTRVPVCVHVELSVFQQIRLGMYVTVTEGKWAQFLNNAWIRLLDHLSSLVFQLQE